MDQAKVVGSGEPYTIFGLIRSFPAAFGQVGGQFAFIIGCRRWGQPARKLNNEEWRCGVVDDL